MAVELRRGAAPRDSARGSLHDWASRLPYGWPLLSLFALYPLWWALGLGPLAAMLLAVPMAWQLRRMRERIVVPKGTGLLLLFLVFTLASVVMLGRVAPGLNNGTHGGALIAFGYRLASYIAATIVLVYVASSDERRLPTGRVLNALATLFVVTVIGGYLGILLPHGSFTSPLELVMPHFVRNNGFAKTIIHPAFSEVQSVLGYPSGRPKAPFEYSNSWGEDFSLLLPFYLIALSGARRQRLRLAGFVLLLASLVPVVLSINRGLWIALGFSVAFAGFQLARRGQLDLVIGAAAAIAVVTILFVVSPLFKVVTDRFAHPHSNVGRAYLYSLSLKGVEESPLLGWGGPRQTSGSAEGIARGASAKCSTCGTAPVGTQGSFWTVLFSTGFVATALILGFFAGALLRALPRADTLAASVSLIILLLLFEQFIYDYLPLSLMIVMTGIGLLVRRSVGSEAAVTAEGPTASVPKVRCLN